MAELQFDEEEVVPLVRAYLDIPLERRFDALVLLCKLVIEGHISRFERKEVEDV